jgi:hypothetical protein
MIRIALPAAMTAVALLTACHSYKPLPLPSPGSAVGKSVRVQFAVPRSVTAARDAGGDSVLRFVSGFEGRVVAVVGDTMQVSLVRITDGAGNRPAPGGMRIGVTPDPSVAVDIRDVDGGRTAALAGGALVGLYVVAAVVAIAAFAAVY